MYIVALTVILVLLVLVLFVIWWRRREPFRSCAGIRDCPADATTGNVLNPFVWPFSGSSNFDVTMSKSRLELENFSEDMEMQTGDTRNHELQSLVQESDHDSPTA